MPKAVIVNYHKCNGCRIHEMACSIRNEGIISTQLSRIAKGQRPTTAHTNQKLDEYTASGMEHRNWNPKRKRDERTCIRLREYVKSESS